MINERNDNPGQGQWSQQDGSRINEESRSENDRRGIDNPELNRDQNSSFEKDTAFNTENEDENDDFLTSGLDDEDDEDDDSLTEDDDFDDDEDDSLTDDEDYDDDPQETKQNQQRTGTPTNPDSGRL